MANKRKSVLAITTILGLSMSSFSNSLAQQNVQVLASPEDTQEEVQIENKESNEVNNVVGETGSKGRGYVKPAYEYKYSNCAINSGDTKHKFYGNSSLPVQYNADINNLAYIPSVKNQGALSTCWTFASNNILESFLMKQNNVNDTTHFDFSENHMRYALGNENGDFMGFARANDGGGNVDMAVAYWSRGLDGWNGPVAESKDPYIESSESREISDISSVMPDNYYVSKVINLGNLEGDYGQAEKNEYIENVKQLVYKYGSVAVSYNSSGVDGFNCNPNEEHENVAYYCNDDETDHAVSIVGWNDNYSRSNFNETNSPSRDGAFLVKNSWGTEWGMNGFLWRSDDTYFQEVYTVAKVDTRDELCDNIYGYDEHGICDSIYYTEGAKQIYYYSEYQTTDSDYEALTAVSTYCLEPGNCYEIYLDPDIYTDDELIKLEIEDYEYTVRMYKKYDVKI